MNIDKRIRYFRKSKGISQEELALKVGVTRQTISNWETGESSPDLKQAANLSKIFNISLDELVGNEIKDILVKKTSNIEKLAGMTIKFIQIITFLILVAIASIIFFANYFKATPTSSYMIGYCQIDNEINHYKVKFDNEGKIIGFNTNIKYINDNLDKLDIKNMYTNQITLINFIEETVKELGGKCGVEPPENYTVKID